MSVVTIAEAWPAAGRPFTVAELDRMPADGRRYELLDGVLIVSPRPTTIHQFVAMRLLRVLADACPDDLCVVPEPAVELGSQTEFDPDLVVVRMDQIGGAKFTEPPLLVVEIRSPSTALVDLNRKKAAYERFGVPTYWIVNPEPPEPELSIFELRDGRYVPAAKASRPFAVDRPFRVSMDPADLTRGLRRLPEAWQVADPHDGCPPDQADPAGLRWGSLGRWQLSGRRPPGPQTYLDWSRSVQRGARG